MPLKTTLRAIGGGVVLLITVFAAVVAGVATFAFRDLDADLYDVVED